MESISTKSDLNHMAKRKPKDPISTQQRLKHGFLAHETVQRIATIANETTNDSNNDLQTVFKIFFIKLSTRE